MTNRNIPGGTLSLLSTSATIALLLALTASPLLARGQEGEVPRFPDGRVNLGPAPGQMGMWTPAGLVQLAANPNATNGLNSLEGNPGIDDVPFKPWARALYDYRQANFEKDEPHTRCKPSGGPRQFMTPYGNEFVQLPEMGTIMITDTGGPHSYRIVYMNAEHPEDLTPTFYGHSIGRWEGDTLVVDTVGYNEKFWFNREGAPHTTELHLVERFTRLGLDSMRYEVTIDDPGAYTEPWTGAFLLEWDDYETWEYICQDNNLSPEGMVGTDIGGERASRVVP
jgi:hypothetical protein